MAVEPFPGGGNGGQGGTLGEPSENNNDITPDIFKFNEKYLSVVLVGLVGYVLLRIIK